MLVYCTVFVLSEKFGGKSQKTGGNLVTRFPAFRRCEILIHLYKSGVFSSNLHSLISDENINISMRCILFKFQMCKFSEECMLQAAARLKITRPRIRQKK